jgi:hypothetical protein
MKRSHSFFWGLLLLPLTLAAVYRTPSALLSLQNEAESLALLFAGAVLYILIEALFERPMRTYVFGHELSHALASIAMGGQVKSFKVSKSGGSVRLTKSNFLVALAPYCLPIYTVFLLLCYAPARKFYPSEALDMALLVGVGATLTFHGSLTLYAIRQDQPDLKQTGTFFSLVFIVFMNCLILAGLSKILFWKSFAAWDFISGVYRTHAQIWMWIWDKAVNFVRFLNETVISRHPGLS